MSDYFSGGPAAGSASPGPSMGMSQPAMSAVPGWYPDPYQPGRVRWFDGYQWTAHNSGYAGSQPGQRDRATEMLLPVNRTGLSIAAGYAGLFSILLVFAPIALILGVLALQDLAHKPDVGGRGRAWFGLAAGAFGTLGLFIVMSR